MTSFVGAEQNFLRLLSSNPAYAIALSIRYGVLASELAELLSDDNLAPSEHSILSGMLADSRLKGFSVNQVQCRTNGSLTSIDSAYLPLGVCCSHKFFHNLQISNEDKKIFENNDVEVKSIKSIDFETVISSTHSNVASVTTLEDGGGVIPVDAIGKQFSGASKVVILDRYFNTNSLRVLTELVDSAHARHGLLSGELLVLMGQANAGVSPQTVEAAVRQYYVDPLSVKASRSNKTATASLHVHDRIMQLDDSVSFTFSAGLGCFYEWNGVSNRAAQIIEIDLFSEHKVARVIREDLGVEVAIKY